MALRRWFHLPALLLAGLAPVGGAESGEGRLPLVWPTPNRAFLEGKGLEAFVQPTASGRLESALFGCVRNGGAKFHEGLDLKSVYRDRRGIPTDPIFAAMPGRVEHVNRVGGNSSYGIYVVLSHQEGGIEFYSLYAHLASVEPGIAPGRAVAQGDRLGVMGSTAGGYSIPNSRAHLHLEFGLRLTEDFNRWYAAQGYRSPNRHGSWNGMNLAGWNPLDFYRKSLRREVSGVGDYLRRLPAAFTLRIYNPAMPDLLRRSPGLAERVVGPERAGWEVDFTAYGLPMRWRSLRPEEVPAGRERGDVEVVNWRPEVTEGACRGMVVEKGGRLVIGSSMQTYLDLLFGSE